MRFENLLESLLLESLLLEGKIDDINNQFPHIPNEVKSNILNRMPNPKSPDTNHYQWLLKQHSLGHLSDSHDIHDILSKFTKNKSTLKKPKLNQYSNIDELHQAVNDLDSASISKKQQASKDTTVLYSSPTMIVRQHHSHQSAIAAAKLPDSNQVKSTVKSAEGEQIGKANWCVSADSELGKTRYDNYTNSSKNPVYSIDTIHSDGSTRRHIYVTNNSMATPEFRNEKQDGTQYDSKFELFAKENPEIMKTPISQHFDPEKRKQMHINDILDGKEINLSTSHKITSADFKPIADKFINDHTKTSFLINHTNLLNDEHIDELIKNKDNHLSLSNKAEFLKPHHIDELIKNKDTHNNLSYQIKHLSPHHIDELIKNKDTHRSISQKLNIIDKKHIDTLIQNPDTHSNLAYHASLLEPHHIDEIIKNPDTHEKLSDNLRYLETKHIDELVKNPNNHLKLLNNVPNLYGNIGDDIINRKLNTSHIDEIIKNKDTHKDLIGRQHILEPHHMDTLANNPDNHDLLSIYNEKLQSSHIDKIIKNPDYGIRLINHPNIQPHHITEIIKHAKNFNDISSHIKTEEHGKIILNRMKSGDIDSHPINFVNSTDKKFNNDLVEHNLKHGNLNMSSLFRNSHIINDLTDENKKNLLAHLSEKVNDGGFRPAEILTKHLDSIHPSVVHEIINKTVNTYPHDMNMEHISNIVHNIAKHPKFKNDLFNHPDFRLHNFLETPEIIKSIKSSINNNSLNDNARRNLQYHNLFDSELNKPRPSISQQFHNKYKLNEGFLNSNFEKLFIRELNKR